MEIVCGKQALPSSGPEPLAVVIGFFLLPPSLLSPSCSFSPSPVSAVAFQPGGRLKICGLKLDQIFSRYRFLGVPGFRTYTQPAPLPSPLFFFPPILPSHSSPVLPEMQSQRKLCAVHTNSAHTARAESHARMHTGNHKLTRSGGGVQLI